MKKFNKINYLGMYIIIIIFGSIILSSCNKENNLLSENGNNDLLSRLPKKNLKNSEYTSTFYKENVDKVNILPEALKYYRNIANLAKWYYIHPNIIKSSNIDYIDTSNFNAILAKLMDISIIDSMNNEQTIFDLSPIELDSFLNAFVLMEANNLSDKLKRLKNREDTTIIAERNIAFENAFPTPQALFSTSEDPYWKILHILDKQEKSNSRISHSDITYRNPPGSFWWQAIINFDLQYQVFHGVPNTLEPQVFVSRIKSSIRKGRLLIALPGGFTTAYPIVIYVGALGTDEWIDFGHVAIMDHNNNELGEVGEGLDFDMTIGTRPDPGMIREVDFDTAWCIKHGVSFVGQVFSVKWHWSWRHGYYAVITDVNNNDIFNEAVSTLGTPYCHWYQVPFAKWAAPDRFICSSASWWCAKEGVDVNISDWWKPTIYPAGVYLSDRVRIVDNTLY